jgi:predicted metal-binding protein
MMERYIQMAKDLKMTNALAITPDDIVFDIRAILKCCWGCEELSEKNIRCQTRNTSYDERLAMIKKYKNILLVHAHDAHELSKVLLAIEIAAFHDGYYFAFALRFCHLCKKCLVAEGKDCPNPSKVRPCEGAFGIDVYKTAHNLGLPCRPLQNKNDEQNRYGFVLID